MKKQSLNPNTLFDSTPFGFSQIVIAKPGKMVFISGQVAWDENRNIVGRNDLAMQVQKTLENLRTAMQAVGGTLSDIVMLRIYKVNLQTEDTHIISKALLDHFGTEHQPASTWLNVQGLANPAFQIEIEAQAIL